MLKFLLDEQLSPKVVIAALKLVPEMVIEAVTTWQDGIYRAVDDHDVLTAATNAGMTLVTYDLRTIPALLRQWAEDERAHAGVVFVDEKTIAQDDFGKLARALAELFKLENAKNWTNRVIFLRP